MNCSCLEKLWVIEAAQLSSARCNCQGRQRFQMQAVSAGQGSGDESAASRGHCCSHSVLLLSSVYDVYKGRKQI